MNGPAITERLDGGDIPTTSRRAGLLVKCGRHLADRLPPRDGVIKPLWKKKNDLGKPNFLYHVYPKG